MAYYPRKEYNSLVDVQQVFLPRYYSVVLKQETPNVKIYYVYDSLGEYVHTAVVRVIKNLSVKRTE